MKTKTVLMGMGLFLMGAMAARAADAKLSLQSSQTNSSIFNLTGNTSDDLYRNWEVSLEGFGTGTVEGHHDSYYDHGYYDYHHHHDNVQGGAGAGLEFFFCRYVGVEVETSSERFFPNFVDDVGGNVVLRLPLGDTGLAPYAFGGAGHQFNPAQATYGDAGAGLEYRFTPMIGVFVDVRGMFPNHHSESYGMGRLGVKFIF